MSTISIPLDKKAMHDLEHLEANNPEMSRSAIVRKAIRLMSEEEAVQVVLDAMKEPTIYEDAVTHLRKRMAKRNK
jgi:metal-responsive CopG/Arc/MetJ family transcriptional regulator